MRGRGGVPEGPPARCQWQPRIAHFCCVSTPPRSPVNEGALTLLVAAAALSAAPEKGGVDVSLEAGRVGGSVS